MKSERGGKMPTVRYIHELDEQIYQLLIEMLPQTGFQLQFLKSDSEALQALSMLDTFFMAGSDLEGHFSRAIETQLVMLWILATHARCVLFEEKIIEERGRLLFLSKPRDDQLCGRVLRTVKLIEIIYRNLVEKYEMSLVKYLA